MAGLILKLRPHEQLLINGVVVENGERKARLRVCTDGANILRLRDAMRPEDATTPLKRAYYAAQMAVAGQLTPSQAQVLIEQALNDYNGAGRVALCDEILTHAAAGEFYKAMRAIKDAPASHSLDAPTPMPARAASR